MVLPWILESICEGRHTGKIGGVLCSFPGSKQRKCWKGSLQYMNDSSSSENGGLDHRCQGYLAEPTKEKIVKDVDCANKVD